MKLGICAYGTVGMSVHNMLESHNVVIYDPDKGYKDFNILLDTEALFVCVPTPTRYEEQNDSILKLTMHELKEKDYKGLIIIKSTVLPTSEIFEYPLNTMVAPEFLNQYEPFFKQDKHLIGVKDIHQAEIYKDIFQLGGYGEDEVRTTDIKTAIMTKYVHNCHGALKVSFFNEMFEVCDGLNINYREMLGGLFQINNNVGEEYTRIGPDGQRGFGGSCFSKDSVAFANRFEIETLKAAIQVNKYYREDEMRVVCGIE